MSLRILVPLDGTSRSERAIPVADQLAEALGAEVDLLRVVDPADMVTTSTAAVTPGMLESAAEAAKEYLHYAGKRFRCVQPASTEVLRGPAAETLVHEACSGEFGLIVISSQARHGLEGLLLGSVACCVVRESTAPILVLRERVALPRTARGLNVLVPLDGSALAEAIVDPLLLLARALGWRLQLFWVADFPPADALAREKVVPAAERAQHERPAMVAYLEQLAERIQGMGVSTEVRIEVGDRGDRIVRCAEPNDVDLIAMSTHGRHGIGRLVLGSVTEHVISHASKPVLAIRPRTD